jgi:hypothetical protein
VLDVSGSMLADTQNASGGESKRYEVGRDAIKQLLASNPGNLRYGLELFGDVMAVNYEHGCGVSSAGCEYPAENCNTVACGYGTAPSITAVLDRLGDQQVAGATPTGPAIVEAGKRADMNDTSRPRYIILVTDGNPSVCTDSPLSDAINALNDIRTQKNVHTFVLGFGGGDADDLNQLAVAGGKPRAADCDQQQCYYSANSAAELNAALSAIVSVVDGEFGGATSCDDSCYAQGCPSGQICKSGACGADPCASVSCPSGVCVEGQCQATCAEPCAVNQRCNNGQCVADVPCSPECTERNQICVSGQCVENYCSGASATLQCPAGYECLDNGCQKAKAPIVPDAGQDVVTSDGGGPGGTVAKGGGCCGGGGTRAAAIFMFGLGLVAMERLGRRKR